METKVKYAVGVAALAALVVVFLNPSSPFAIGRFLGEGLETPSQSADQAEGGKKRGARQRIGSEPLDPRLSSSQDYKRQITKKELDKLIEDSGRSSESLFFACQFLGWDKDYLRELRARKDDPCANLLLALQEIDPIDRAEAAGRLAKLQPDNALGYLLLATAKTSTSDFGEASSLLRQASKLKLTDIGQAAYVSQFGKMDQYADPQRVNFDYMMLSESWRSSIASGGYAPAFDRRNFTNPDTGEFDLESYKLVSRLTEASIPTTSSNALQHLVNQDQRVLTQAATSSPDLPGLKEELGEVKNTTKSLSADIMGKMEWRNNATPAELDAKAVSIRTNEAGRQ